MSENKSLGIENSTSNNYIAPNSRIDHRPILIEKYIEGNGIEVGALHQPVKLSDGVSVKYVDRMSVDDLRKHYPELRDLPLTPVDIIDNGEELLTFRNNTLDFIIANHFLEHTQDPIGTIKRHVSVLKASGILYLAIPDKRFTFDKLRPSTTLDHFIDDHEKGPSGSYLGHVHEYVRLVDHLEGDLFEQKVNEICKTNYSIHFHVWDSQDIRVFLERLIIERYKIPVTILAIVDNPIREECICVLQKKRSIISKIGAKLGLS